MRTILLSIISLTVLFAPLHAEAFLPQGFYVAAYDTYDLYARARTWIADRRAFHRSVRDRYNMSVNTLRRDIRKRRKPRSAYRSNSEYLRALKAERVWWNDALAQVKLELRQEIALFYISFGEPLEKRGLPYLLHNTMNSVATRETRHWLQGASKDRMIQGVQKLSRERLFNQTRERIQAGRKAKKAK